MLVFQKAGRSIYVTLSPERLFDVDASYTSVNHGLASVTIPSARNAVRVPDPSSFKDFAIVILHTLRTV